VRLSKLLAPLETPRCPFDPCPKTNEPPHWVRPELIAEVKFTEWTADHRLRHPVYMGLRDDKKPIEVVKEQGGAASARPRTLDKLEKVVAQLEALEDARRDGTIDLPNGDRIEVGNLHKVFWPDLKITKGELLRYYARVSPLILPAVADRPLVLKRFPNGIRGKAFYQQQVTQDPPRGVRMEVLPDEADPIGEPNARRYVGGTLPTLLHLTQLAAISQDPWFSRVQSPEFADHVAIDLDPSEGVTFAQVLDVARWTHDELERLRVPSFPKTSGSRGLHVYIPLPRRTTYEAGLLFCQIVATLVASKHPRAATIERSVARRGRTVYVDYLQNILGKTLATAYSARASDYAGVSTPLTWTEIHDGVDPRAYTLRTTLDRFRRVGDLWEQLRKAKGADLRAALASVGAGPQASGRRMTARRG
jgi:bifunctional non-homologous end joining protein LigD